MSTRRRNLSTSQPGVGNISKATPASSSSFTSSSAKPSMVDLKHRMLSSQHTPSWPVFVMTTILFAFRFLGALLVPVMDCDETFNYVEPIHMLTHGHGLQTWEYSPVYALRSYLFLWLHAVVVFLCRFIGVEATFSKVASYHIMRVVVCLFSSLCQALLVRSVGNRFGRKAGYTVLFFMLFAPGLSHASHSVLPQTFSMNFITLAIAKWLDTLHIFLTVSVSPGKHSLAKFSNRRNSNHADHNSSGSSSSDNENHFPQSHEKIGSPLHPQPTYEKLDAKLFKHQALLIFYAACAGLLGWPFVIILILPLGLTILFQTFAHSAPIKLVFGDAQRSANSLNPMNGGTFQPTSSLFDRQLVHLVCLLHMFIPSYDSFMSRISTSKSQARPPSGSFGLGDSTTKETNQPAIISSSTRRSGSISSQTSKPGKNDKDAGIPLKSLSSTQSVELRSAPLNSPRDLNQLDHQEGVYPETPSFVPSSSLSFVMSFFYFVNPFALCHHSHKQEQDDDGISLEPNSNSNSQENVQPKTSDKSSNHELLSSSKKSSKTKKNGHDESPSIQPVLTPPSIPSTVLTAPALFSAFSLTPPFDKSSGAQTHVLMPPKPLSQSLFHVIKLGCAALLSAGFLTFISVVLDAVYYRRVPVFAFWNIAMYNSNFSGDSGDTGAGQQLYGTEPLSYYFINLFLNFNVALLLFIGFFCAFTIFFLSRFLLVCLDQCFAKSSTEVQYRFMYRFAQHICFDFGLSKRLMAQFWVALPAVLWILAMFPQPHKEERFLFVIYPLICLIATFGFECTLECAQFIHASIGHTFFPPPAVSVTLPLGSASGTSVSSSSGSNTGSSSSSSSLAASTPIHPSEVGFVEQVLTSLLPSFPLIPKIYLAAVEERSQQLQRLRTADVLRNESNPTSNVPFSSSTFIVQSPYIISHRLVWFLTACLYLGYCIVSISRSIVLLYNYSAFNIIFFTLQSHFQRSIHPTLLALSPQMLNGSLNDNLGVFNLRHQGVVSDYGLISNNSANTGVSTTHSFSNSTRELSLNLSLGELIFKDVGQLGRPPMGYPLQTLVSNHPNFVYEPLESSERYESNAPISTVVMRKNTEDFTEEFGQQFKLQLSGLSLVQQQHLLEETTVARICLGKDWYRFPSSFYLPEAVFEAVLPTIETPIVAAQNIRFGDGVGSIIGNEKEGYLRMVSPRFEIAFIDSGFGGILPQHFASNVKVGLRGVTDATSTIPPNMNELNQKEPSRFVPVSKCDFIVDTLLGTNGAGVDKSTRFVDDFGGHHDEFVPLFQMPMINSEQSSSFHRAFFVYSLWERKNKFNPVVLWYNTKR